MAAAGDAGFGAATFGDRGRAFGRRLTPGRTRRPRRPPRLDRAATGLDRHFLLSSFLSRPETRAWRTEDGRGFVIARAGRRAIQIGPLVAGDAAQAAALLDIAIAAATAHDAGQAIFLDLPRVHRPLADKLERQGFARQRPFVRMSLGASEAPRLGTGLFVLAGPEFG